jgi:hypothetical protein
MNSIAIANPAIANLSIAAAQMSFSRRAAIPDSAIAVALAKIAVALVKTATDSANTTRSGAKEGNAAITALVAPLLQAAPAATASNSAQTSAAGAAIILTQLLNPTNDAAPMDLNLNQLLNSAQSLLQQTLGQGQRAVTQLPPELLSRPQVIEALVLQNTLLPAATTTESIEQAALPLLQLPNSGNATTTQSPASTLYRINIQWQNRILQLLSSEPLPTGTRVPLQITARGEIALLPPAIAAKMLSQQISSQQNVTQQNISTNTATPQPLTRTPLQTIQQSLREWLPRQQSLHTLVPLLQKFIEPAVREQLPQPVFKALAQLLQSLPKPAQVTNAENLKQTLNNSGSFFEARIARALTSDPASAEALPKIFASDLKAQIGALIEIIRKISPEVPARATVPTSEDDFIYAAKPAPQQAAPHNIPSHESNHLDTLLTQLSKLLESGLARIQLNQLDSASARHVNHEASAPVPTWVLELPLRTAYGVDQLQLRIEQRHKQHQQRTRVQWNVEIAFDLHAAGKLAASLAIIDKSVSATLWAEREQTHRRVREEMDYLRAGLESVGVNVTDMQCRLGLPAPRSNPISQQLVDVHT